jgi:hypothetical protein
MGKTNPISILISLYLDGYYHYEKKCQASDYEICMKQNGK